LRILKGKAPERAIVTQILNCVVRLPGLRTDLDLKTKWRACEPFFKHQLKSDNNNLTVQFFLNSFNATEEAVDEWLAASLNPDLSTRTQIRRRFCNPEFDASFFKSKTIQVQKAPPQQMVQMELKIDVRSNFRTFNSQF
jgi:macrodomain Ter protein organizer (MatP/YcbG family)